jgi:glucosamine-6-phosphate deaminase
MKIIIMGTEQDLHAKAADLIGQQLREKPASVLGLATGSTPIGTYQELIRRYRAEKLDFSQATTFNLDEYYSLSDEHPQSYHAFMHEKLFDRINVPKERINIPSGTPLDVGAYCESYDKKIEAAGGIDLQLLGIGFNGHIGFNEPADQLEPNTHLIKLTENTIEANARFFDNPDEVPKYAITMGVGTILKSKKLLLLATGRSKSEIIHKLVYSGISTQLPASLLKLHPDATILVDQEAGILLKSMFNLGCEIVHEL